MPSSRQPPDPVSVIEPEALKPRFAALTLLQAALQRRGGFEEAASAKSFTSLPARDRAFARALALATLRNLGPIDRALQSSLHKTPPDVVLNLLRLGATQIFHLNTPAFAAVTTSVEMAQSNASTRPFKGVVNAVLRGLTRSAAVVPEARDYAPSWLYARWRAHYGEAGADAIAARIPQEPGTDLSVRSEEYAEAVAAGTGAIRLKGGSLRTDLRGDVAEWPGFEEGRWWVQDAAAAVPARLLGSGLGRRALDLCAAPGGKTLQLAAAGFDVVALDRSAFRLRRLEDNLRRTGLRAEVIAADAAGWDDERLFDAVLLDAPCSATGTFRRHPDVLWAVKPSDIAKLAAVQADLLDAAAKRVLAEGVLVYCVCSLEPEEGEAQIAPFLARRPDFVIVPPALGEAGLSSEALTVDGACRLTPGLAEPEGGVDGFFIARFRRRV